ncbi:MAG TPA: hypothetical protein PLJ00_05785 [Chitinophagales bacterium]|nr:hypothetical protein [Chitinophagales bacterium]
MDIGNDVYFVERDKQKYYPAKIVNIVGEKLVDLVVFGYKDDEGVYQTCYRYNVLHVSVAYGTKANTFWTYHKHLYGTMSMIKNEAGRPGEQ